MTQTATKRPTSWLLPAAIATTLLLLSPAASALMLHPRAGETQGSYHLEIWIDGRYESHQGTWNVTRAAAQCGGSGGGFVTGQYVYHCYRQQGPAVGTLPSTEPTDHLAMLLRPHDVRYVLHLDLNGQQQTHQGEWNISSRGVSCQGGGSVGSHTVYLYRCAGWTLRPVTLAYDVTVTAGGQEHEHRGHAAVGPNGLACAGGGGNGDTIYMYRCP